MTKVKFCGITNLDDAKLAVELGADALGYNFYRRSPRFIEPAAAQAIVRSLPASVMNVGVFVNEERAAVEETARMVGLDTLQFHGDEDVSICEGWDSWNVIRAVRVATVDDISRVHAALEAADFALVDTHVEGEYGGTGKAIAEEVMTELAEQVDGSRLIIAGGLTPESVGDIVQTLVPFAVDVASGIECVPGNKSVEKMATFIEAVGAALEEEN